MDDPEIVFPVPVGEWKDFERSWWSVENFLAKGASCCVLRENEVVSWCVSDCAAGHGWSNADWTKQREEVGILHGRAEWGRFLTRRRMEALETRELELQADLMMIIRLVPGR